MHVDVFDRERPAPTNIANGVERGVVAADAGIEFQRNAHGLEALAEPGTQRREIEAILRAREGRAKAAIGRFEDVDDAGEVLPRQQRRIKPALRGASGMHALDHGAVLRRHQAGRLRAGNAKRVHGGVGGKSQRPRRAGRRREHADRGAGMPALADMLLAHAQADARADLIAGDGGGEKIAAGQFGMALRHRDQRRQRDRADMQDRGAMHVVELEALHLRAVDQGRVRRR